MQHLETIRYGVAIRHSRKRKRKCRNLVYLQFCERSRGQCNPKLISCLVVYVVQLKLDLPCRSLICSIFNLPIGDEKQSNRWILTCSYLPCFWSISLIMEFLFNNQTKQVRNYFWMIGRINEAHTWGLEQRTNPWCSH